jgi:putative transposase
VARRRLAASSPSQKAQEDLPKDASVIRLRPKYPNYIWAIDFVHDKLSNGRPYKMLTVMDDYTRQALTVHVGAKLGSAEVLEALYPLIIKHGKPEHIRSDNGPEFVSKTFQIWLKRVGIEPIHITQARHGRMDITNVSKARFATKS